MIRRVGEGGLYCTEIRSKVNYGRNNRMSRICLKQAGKGRTGTEDRGWVAVGG